jgi:2-phospho-L-lactate guanylyltransferase (CobY/MobA/RfbA family)
LIISVLKHLGIVCWRNNSQGTFDAKTGAFRQMTGHARKGVSDIIGVLPGGRALFIEVKAARGKTSPDQDSFLADTANAGALSFVAKSLEDVIVRLTDIPGLDKTEIERLMQRLKESQ